ncbi:MAG: hypothetical protein AB7O24_04900 [Kofleriaceae bacterium]
MANRNGCVGLVGCAVMVMALATMGCGGWTKRDTALQLTFAAAAAADWAQTRSVVSSCDEQNPFIGACGDNIPPGVWFPLTGLIHSGIAAALPPKWRTAWQALTIGAEVNMVWMNHANGYRLDGGPRLDAVSRKGDR